MPMDWDVMVEDLEGKRAAAAQELADIDEVLAIVYQRAGGTPATRTVAKPKAKAKTATPAHKNGAKGGHASSADTAVARAQAKKLWEKGEPVKDIAKATGRAIGSIYAWSSEGKWKRPKSGAAAPPAAAAPIVEPAGTKLSGSVKCTDPECGAWTDYDPCRTCGKKLKRKGW